MAKFWGGRGSYRAADVYSSHKDRHDGQPFDEGQYSPNGTIPGNSMDIGGSEGPSPSRTVSQISKRRLATPTASLVNAIRYTCDTFFVSVAM